MERLCIVIDFADKGNMQSSRQIRSGVSRYTRAGPKRLKWQTFARIPAVDHDGYELEHLEIMSDIAGENL